MRDVPFAQSRAILQTVAKGFDGKDLAYLEAFGTGCEGKEKEMYSELAKTMGLGQQRRKTAAEKKSSKRATPAAAE